MTLRKIIIQDDIFELFPDFYRGIIVVKEITNHPSLKRVRKLLKKVIDSQQKVRIEEDERLKAWDAAHRKFGSNPNKFPPSIKSLMKRIQKNPALPYINSVVAMFNLISLKYCLPCGGDDVKRIQGDLVLGLADGTETFMALGMNKSETPSKGEVIYFDSYSKNVMCRRWNWRNADRTKIEVTTEHIVINIDCLPPQTPDVANTARDEMADLLKDHCTATLLTDCLHAKRREINLEMK
jgi:DNA/RNA-binding domain of Phe-tRNA-synthetase-like protein